MRTVSRRPVRRRIPGVPGACGFPAASRFPAAPRFLAAPAILAAPAFLAVAALAASCSSGTAAQSAPGAAGITCSYPDSGSPARPVDRPGSLNVPGYGTVPATLRTSAGEIGLTLDRSSAPCAVHSFASLVRQKYFVHTPCHRLTVPPAPVSLLQCGDPTGTGAGGPGYAVQDEPPTGLVPADGDPGAVVYPRGTVALSNHGVPDSGGSQFFLVYQDSPLPPTFSVLGQVDAASLPVLDAIVEAGADSATSPGDGHPLTPVTLQAVVLPAG